MVKKKTEHRKQNQTDKEVSKMDSSLEKEIELERTEPEKIVKDELNLDKNTKEEKDNPELQRNSLKLFFITIIVIAVLLASIFVVTRFMANRFEPNYYTYNGFSFMLDPNDDLWYTEFVINDTLYPLPFHYSPRDLEDVGYNVDEQRLLSSEFIYLSLPPMEQFTDADGRRLALAAVEVGKIIGTRNNIFNIPARAVLSSEPEIDYDDEDFEAIVANCQNASQSVAVIMFRMSDVKSVYEESENCYYVQGPTGRDVMMAADRLAYGLLGIMG
ncbi:MAG: hypothetical protein ACOCUR_00165 [Nanoarchaeota archaeon]